MRIAKAVATNSSVLFGSRRWSLMLIKTFNIQIKSTHVHLIPRPPPSLLRRESKAGSHNAPCLSLWKKALRRGTLYPGRHQAWLRSPLWSSNCLFHRDISIVSNVRRNTHTQTQFSLAREAIIAMAPLKVVMTASAKSIFDVVFKITIEFVGSMSSTLLLAFIPPRSLWHQNIAMSSSVNSITIFNKSAQLLGKTMASWKLSVVLSLMSKSIE
mmetsp:Transcript_20016/g.33023  ORF Transcript_20016/g.33023 Transcript_20016/m.33023 type:complete len:213 (+) Transcript_20016:2460-3098(+)